MFYNVIFQKLLKSVNLILFFGKDENLKLFNDRENRRNNKITLEFTFER
jgi:hypothetical protein